MCTFVFVYELGTLLERFILCERVHVLSGTEVRRIVPGAVLYDL